MCIMSCSILLITELSTLNSMCITASHVPSEGHEVVVQSEVRAGSSMDVEFYGKALWELYGCKCNSRALWNHKPSELRACHGVMLGKASLVMTCWPSIKHEAQ